MGDTSDFERRLGILSRAVGFGHLRGEVEVDQIYAHWIHENRQFKHPRGGQANYLGGPLFEKNARYMRVLADAAITRSGSDLEDAMVWVVEDLSGEVRERAPKQFGNLAESVHPSVTSHGNVIYDRAPVQKRLTEAEIRAERGGDNAGL